MADTREFEEVEYGVVASVPKGKWMPDGDYDVANIVSHDGSSYQAFKKPPVGTLPTDTTYWQTSAQGASKATPDALGVVKPDNITTEVDENAVMSVKTATQTTKGIVKGSPGIKIDNDGSVDINTAFEQATQLANLIAGEAISVVLGKVSKSIATTMGLEQNVLLKNMLTNINVNDVNKIPTAALAYAMQQAIIKNENDITQLNSDLVYKYLVEYNVSNGGALLVKVVGAYNTGHHNFIIYAMGNITDAPSTAYAQVRVTNNGNRYIAVEWINDSESNGYIAKRMIDTQTMQWAGNWFVPVSNSDLLVTLTRMSGTAVGTADGVAIMYYTFPIGLSGKNITATGYSFVNIPGGGVVTVHEKTDNYIAFKVTQSSIVAYRSYPGIVTCTIS